ncbi:MAG: Glu-tRNA(Gln) amidotransferase subunit GatD [Candidatus Nanohaloarchaea archaeon]
MYSGEIQQQLEEEGIEVGDRVSVDGHEGRLMPKPESGDPETFVIKLESGYNIGVRGEPELVEKQESSEREKPDIEHEEDRPDILVLHTGGTIASRVSYEEGGVKASYEPEDLVQMYPELDEEVNLHSEVAAQIMSEDMEPGHWQDIARKIDEVKDDYDGIIIGHGTDTMAYTGAALRLMLKGIDTGVLLVGAQRSSDRPSTDATMNLYCAGKFLAETDFKGVGICMHGSSSDDECHILNSAKARKMHTSRRDAFQPINSKPLGKVNYQTGEIETDFEERNDEYEFRPELDTDVAYLKTRPGMKVEEFETVLDHEPSGLIIEGTGLGHMPSRPQDEHTEHHQDMLERVSEIADDALTVMTSQCVNGRVDMNVYANQLRVKNEGVIGARDMHPELAYVKMMWALGQASGEDAEELFRKNVNVEISERSLYGN